MTAPARTIGPALGTVGTPGGGRSPVGRRTPPPLRVENKPDDFDSARVSWYWSLYRSQDGALLTRDRTIEECVRMLCGQQWTVFNPLLNRFFDISDWMTNAEKRWRQRPVVNKLLKWFILTHARLTENPPILTFLPGPDALDAELAEVMDVAFKLTWRDANMTDVVDRLAMWAIPAGRAHLVSRIDLTKGPWKPWLATAEVPLLGQGPDGQHALILGQDGQPVRRPAQNVPITKDGQIAAGRSIHDGSLLPLPGMQAHAEREGGISVDVCSPLEVRGEWGPQPWYDKQWHARESFLTPAQVESAWGVPCDPDTSYDDANSGILDRMLYGTGYYGAASARGSSGSGGLSEARDGLVRVIECWERPSDAVEGMQETEQEPGGRYIVVTSKQVLRDGPRPVRFPYTSPIHTFDFVRVPGRPSGTSPQEALNGPQRSYNKLRAQVMEHANLVSNPRYVMDSESGIEEGQWTNEPGRGVKARMRPGVKAVEYITPPALGSDVYKAIEFASSEIDELGALKGTDGAAVSPDQSGEAIKELRFNSDRFLGPTTRRWVEEFSRMAETWMAYMPIIWDEERVLSFAGSDNIATTVSVLPALFQQGKVHVIPDVESMLPEGRGERQAQVYAMYRDGIFGMPGSPQAIGKLMEIGRFPNISRAAKPGGPDAITAEHENGKLSMGALAQEIPILPWYDDQIHVATHERVMKSPEFLKLPPQVQQQYALHWQQHVIRIQEAMARAQQQAAEQAAQQGGGPGGGQGTPHGPPRGAPKPQGGPSSGPSSQPVAPSQPSMPATAGPGALSPTGLSRPGLSPPTQG